MIRRTHIEQSTASNELCPLNCHDGQLHHLGNKTVTAKFLRDAAHDQLMSEGTNKERDQGCYVSRDVRSGSPVDMAAEEVMYRNVPLAGKLEPRNF